LVQKTTQGIPSELQVQECSGASDSKEAAQEENPKSVIGIVGIDFTAEQYLEQRGVTYRKNDSFAVAKCPACKPNKRTLAVEREFGAWSCTNCNRSGSFRELKKLFGDTSALLAGAPDSSQFEVEIPMFTPVRFHKDYIKALKKKGCDIPDNAVRAFSIGYSEEYDALVFPYRFGRSTKTTSYLRFLRTPSDWWRVAGDSKTSAWFGQHLLKPGFDEVVVCRNPYDVAMMYAAGERNILASYGDERGVKLRAHHLSVLHRAAVVYVVMDGTDEGEAWSRSVQSQVGKWRCKLVDYAFHDHGYDLSKFQAAKAKAAVCRGLATHRSSRWLDDLDEEFIRNPLNKQTPTNLEPLDKILGGWRFGEVTVLSGESGIGKSTLASFLALLQGSSGSPTLFLTFEVLPKNVVKKWITMLADGAFEGLSKHEYGVSRRKLANRPMFVGDNYGMVELSEIRRCIYDSATRHGTRFLVIDHLGHLCSERKQDEPHIAVEGRILREIKRWSMDLNIHILLLAHLRKQGIQKTKQRALDDLRGSAEIYQTADNVMLLERKRGEESNSIIRLLKCRDDAGYEGSATFAFDTESLRFSPL